MYFFLGIDDTDSTDAGDTSELALALGQELENLALAKLVNISAHQLIQQPTVPCTSSNCAACLYLDTAPERGREIDLACRQFLLASCEPGSNPGYTLAAVNQFSHEVAAWGKTAQLKLLQRQEALTLGRNNGLVVASIMGSGCGVIGALAAVGLRFEGNDGIVTWMPGLSGLSGVYTQIELTRYIRFDRIENERQRRPAFDERILIEGSFSPILRDGKVVLPVTAAKRGQNFEWQVISP